MRLSYRVNSQDFLLPRQSVPNGTFIWFIPVRAVLGFVDVALYGLKLFGLLLMG